MEKNAIVYLDGIKKEDSCKIKYSTTLKDVSQINNEKFENDLSLGKINIRRKTFYDDFEMVLCKPNKEEISILHECSNKEISVIFNDIDELKFEVPYYVEKQYGQEINPNWDLLKEDYLVRVGRHYFIIVSTETTSTPSKDTKNVHCYSLEYQLTKRKLRGMIGTRQLYKSKEDGTVVKIKYSTDGRKWNTYTNAFEILDDETVYFKTLDRNNKVLNNFIWNVNNKINETKGISVRSKLLEIKKDSIARKLSIDVKIIAEIGEGILNILENETTWKIGHIDQSVREDDSFGQDHRRYRTFNITEKSWMAVLKEEIQKAFCCYVFFDTDKKEINIYDKRTYKNNKGLYISHENYIKTIKKDVKDTEIVTRLHVFGKENKSIATINPTGKTYIENYDYYRSEKYMPKDLLNAMDMYFGSLDNSMKGLLSEKSGEFTTLYRELEALRLKDLRLNNEKVELISLYKIADDNVDYAIQTNAKDNTEPKAITGVGKTDEDLTQHIIQNLQDVNRPKDLSELNEIKRRAKKDVENKEKEIKENNENIEDKIKGIELLKQILAKDRKKTITVEGKTYPINFTENHLKLLDEFIKEETWQKDIFVDFYNANDLMVEGKMAIDKMSKPIIEFELDMIDFLNIIECQRDWDKLVIGDMINIYYGKFNLEITARLVKIEHTIDNNSLKITVSTNEEIADPSKYLTQISSNASDAKNSIDMFKHNWDLGTTNQDQISNIINNALDTAKNRVLSGRNQNIRIDERGICMKDMFDEREQLRIVNNVLAFTKDNWETCSTAISPDGIVAQEIYGKIVGSNRLIITNMNDKGESSFLVDKDHMKAINMDLSLLNKLETNRIYLNPDVGIKIQQKRAGDWSDIIWLGMDGRIQCKYMIATNLEIRNDEGDLLLDSEHNYLDLGRFDKIVSDGKLTPVEKLSVRKEWLRIQIEYPKVIIQAQKYNTTTRDDKEMVDTKKYTDAYLKLRNYIVPLLADMDYTSDVDKKEFEENFEGYYKEVKEVMNKIEDSLKYSSLQLGQWYNHTLIDAINGITVTKVIKETGQEVARTTMNASTGISISTCKNGVWEDNFWVDMKGNLIAKNIQILDQFNRPAFEANDKGELDLEGRLRVMRYEDDSINSGKKILVDVYKDEKVGGKILINNWNEVKNVYLGSSPTPDFIGGFLRTFNDDGDLKIELGTYKEENAGRINLYGNDNKCNVEISAIDDVGQSAGIIKLYNKQGERAISLMADTNQNPMKREHVSQMIFGEDVDRPRLGLFSGNHERGSYIQMGDKKGMPQMFIGNVSIKETPGGCQVWYANMDDMSETFRKARVQVFVNGQSNGQIDLWSSASRGTFDNADFTLSMVTQSNDDMLFLHKSGRRIRMSMDGKIYFE